MLKKVHGGLVLALIFTFMLNSLALANSPVSEPRTAASISQAVKYLHSIQNKDGGFPSKAGAVSNTGTTCWIVMALEATGEDVTGPVWTTGGRNPVNYLQNSDITFESTNDYCRLLLALTAGKQQPVYKNINLADKIITFQQSDGHFAQPQLQETGFINCHLWSILALASAGYEIPRPELAKKWLVERQNEDGGFGWAEGIPSDSDDTGIAVQTLIILGEDPKSSVALKKAITYLEQCQEDDGGFNSGNDWMSSGSNASSSAWTLQGLIAAGEDPAAAKWTKNGNNPISYLIKLQNQYGSYNWKTDIVSSPAAITAQTIMALAQRPFPINIDYANKEKPAAVNGMTDLNK